MKPRRALWGVVLAVALGLSIAAIATSPAWETPPPDSSLTPPFDEPAIAAIMPDDDVASQAFGTPMVRIIDRPPNTRVYALNTDVAQDYRDVAIEQAWERQWRSPHQMQEAAVIVEVITSATISAPSVTCEAEEPLSIPGADSAGIRVRTDDMTAACAAITRGRTHVGIQINEPSGDDSHLVATLSALVEHIEPLVEETPAQPTPESIEFPRQRIAALRREMLAVGLLLVILVALPMLLDRSLWRRLLTRWAPGQPNPLHDDVEPERRHWSQRATAIGACRLALVLWAVRLAPEVSSRTHTALAYVVPVLAYVGGLWLQHALTPRNGTRRRSLIRGAAAIPAALGALGSLALLVAAALLWGLGSTAMMWGSGTGALATWELVGTASVTMITALVAVFLIRVPTTVGRRWAMSAMKNQPRGEGRPVLMLRTFGDDTVELRVRRPDRAGFLDSLLMKRGERFEELVALMLSSYGPPIAVGQPGQVLAPGLGAQRFTFSDDTWQAAVRDFAEESALITVFIGKTAGLSWELNLVASSGYLHKTVFLMPPVSVEEMALRLAVFANAYDLPSELLDTQTVKRVPLAICWPLGSTEPLVVSASSADDISYDIAIQRCVSALSGDLDSQPPRSGLSALPKYRELGLPSERPARRGLLSNPPLLYLISSILAVGAALLLVLTTGNGMGTDGALARTIFLNDGHSATSTLGGRDSEGWAVLNLSTIVHGDFDTGQVTHVADLDGPAFTVVRRGSTAFAVEAGWLQTTRQVSAVDLDTGQVRWRLELPELTEGLAATDTTVYVTQADEQALWVIDAASGHLDKRIPLGCTPWGVSASDGQAIVACPVEGQVITVSDGTPSATESAPIGTLYAAEVNGQLMAYVPAQDEILNLANGAALYLSVGEPAFAMTTNAIAAQGVDRVSLFTEGEILRWNARPSVTSLDIADDGASLHYAAGSTWYQLLPE